MNSIKTSNVFSKEIPDWVDEIIFSLEEKECIESITSLVLLWVVELKEVLDDLSTKDMQDLTLYWWEFLIRQAQKCIKDTSILNFKQKKLLLEIFFEDDPEYPYLQQILDKQIKNDKKLYINSDLSLEQLLELIKYFDENDKETYILLQLIKEYCINNFEKIKNFEEISKIYNLYVDWEWRVIQNYIDDIKWFHNLQDKLISFTRDKLAVSTTFEQIKTINENINRYKSIWDEDYIIPWLRQLRIEVRDRLIKASKPLLHSLLIENLTYIKNFLQEDNEIFQEIDIILEGLLSNEILIAKDLKSLDKLENTIDVFLMDKKVSFFSQEILKKKYELGKKELEAVKGMNDLYTICDYLSIKDFLYRKSIPLSAEYEELLSIAISKRNELRKEQLELEQYICDKRKKYFDGDIKDELIAVLCQREGLNKLISECQNSSPWTKEYFEIISQIKLICWINFENISNFDTLFFLYTSWIDELRSAEVADKIIKVANINDAESLSTIILPYEDYTLENILSKILSKILNEIDYKTGIERIIMIAKKFYLEDGVLIIGREEETSEVPRFSIIAKANEKLKELQKTI